MKERTSGEAVEPERKKRKKGNTIVENIESIVVAVILALIIRAFVVEAFVIPTGSMASSLYGNHLALKCPNCGFKYAVGFNAGSEPVSQRVLCPNCGEPAPNWHGKAVYGGDRILVNKVIYRFFKPERWDPFVFVNPNVRKGDPKPYKTTYIKRLVGMPGDEFEIVRGDVVVNGEIQRKPADAQSRLWMPVYDVNYPWKRGQPWNFVDGGWSLDGKRLVVDASADAPARAQYAGRLGKGLVIRDDYGYDQDRLVVTARPAGTGAGLNVVTDLRVSFDLEGAAASGKLTLILLCDDHDHRAILDFSAGRATLAHVDQELKSIDLPKLSGDAKHHVTFYRLDYLLVLAIDGRDTLEYDLWSREEYERLVERGRAWQRWVELGREPDAHEVLEGHTTSGVVLDAVGTKLELTDFRIDRDVYYTYPGQTEPGGNHYFRLRRKIPEGCYFAMGDNSPDSYDSRYWPDPWVPSDHLIGKALVIWWHPTRIRLIH